MSDNPYESPQQRDERQVPDYSLESRIVLAMVSTVIAIIVAFSILAVIAFVFGRG